ncbi:Cse1-domain-containing protein [Kalaharituber pfeilii]|nr:Cse1-domain-containing protein [Kalaharituber pfeilii]
MADIENAATNREVVATLLRQSLHPATSKQAEASLRSLESTPGFSLTLLNIVASNAQDSQGMETRLAAALFFKNFIRRNWTDEDGNYRVPANDVIAIKREIVGLMISVPYSLQVQLGEAISIIADSDFYQRWDTLVDDLVKRLTPDNTAVNNGVLQVAHSIFKRWRPLFRTDALYTEINHVLGKFCVPFLELLETTNRLIEQNKNNKQALTDLFQTLNLMVKIYFDLNCQDLPPSFEELLPEIMSIFHKYLTYTNPLLDTDDDNESGPLERVKAGICEVLVLYTHKYEDVFDKLLQNFVNSTWMLLTNIGLEAKYDILVSKALQFLTAVAKIRKHAENFKSENVLEQVVEKIILPNMSLRSSDEELFEDDPIEFIRRDMDGSDNDTRRRAATDFLRQLMEQYEKSVTEVVFKYIDHYIQEYKKDPRNNWRCNDTALYLFTSIAIKGTVSAIGVTSTNLLVDVVDFFSKHVAANLVAPFDDVQPILKVDAIKYLHTFRSQMTKAQLSDAFPLLAKHLAAENFVVYTYAAITIERILAMSAEGQALFKPEEISPLAQEILGHLFRLITRGNTPEQIAENEYLMKCVMRILIVCRETIAPHTEFILTQLLKILVEISKNPSNPRFNHYCFESFGAVIRFVAPVNPTYLESTLHGPFISILTQDVQEFMPYVFQLLALLIESNPSALLPERYQLLIGPLLAPVLWESRGNVPALVRLLQAITARASSIIVAQGQLEPILGIFQKLISSKLNESHAFDLLEAIVLNFQVVALQAYWKQIFIILFTRLKNSKTDMFAQRFSRFFYFLVVREKEGGGPDFVVKAMDVVQGGIFGEVFSAVVIPDTQKLQKPLDRKLAVIGLTKLLLSSASLATPPYNKACPHAATLLFKLLAAPEVVPQGPAFTDDVSHEADLDETGFAVSFSTLNTTKRLPKDPAPEVPMAGLRGWVIGEFKKSKDRSKDWLPEEARSLLGE